jgi:hypothetical protein
MSWRRPVRASRPARAGARPDPLDRRRAIEGVAASDDDPALAACALWEAAIDEIGEPLPAVEAGLRWLRLNPPPAPPRERLVHGDFRLGNLIVDESGLAAVIDWELCHSGDPAEDIGWLCVPLVAVRQRRSPRRGCGSLDESARRLRGAGGEPPRWSGSGGGRRWATSSGRVICARQAHDHLTGCGRRPSWPRWGGDLRAEWDLLELLPAVSSACVRDSSVRKGRRTDAGSPDGT